MIFSLDKFEASDSQRLKALRLGTEIPVKLFTIVIIKKGEVKNDMA